MALSVLKIWSTCSCRQNVWLYQVCGGSECLHQLLVSTLYSPLQVTGFRLCRCTKGRAEGCGVSGASRHILTIWDIFKLKYSTVWVSSKRTNTVGASSKPWTCLPQCWMCSNRWSQRLLGCLWGRLGQSCQLVCGTWITKPAWQVQFGCKWSIARIDFADTMIISAKYRLTSPHLTQTALPTAKWLLTWSLSLLWGWHVHSRGL